MPLRASVSRSAICGGAVSRERIPKMILVAALILTILVLSLLIGPIRQVIDDFIGIALVAAALFVAA